MTIFFQKDRQAWRYDFRYRGARFVSPRGFPTKGEARDAEAEKRRQLRRIDAGLELPRSTTSVRIADFAETYMEHIERRGRHQSPETIERTLRVALRFWGRRPDRRLKPHEEGPYHDLTLHDPIDHPSHLLAFEQWLATRKVRGRPIAGATKNHLRTALSRLYAVALLPEYRAATGVTMNPFRGLERDRPVGRTVTLSVAQLRAILAASPRHLQLALAIATLAPKLRMGNILELRWDQHLDADLTRIQVARHKTASVTRLPLVSPISGQLRAILQAARAQQPKKVPWVIHYRRDRVYSIDTGLQAACKAAGVPYGHRSGGATFHTLRHTAATLLASLGVPEGIRKDVMGHLSIATTQRYTHLNPVHQEAPLEQLSQAVPLEDLLVGKPVERVRRSRAKTTRQEGSPDGV